MTGVELWRGPSFLGGSPIVAIATVGSSNRKTGPMVQVWILRQDVDPVRAIATGADSAICGDCRHRGDKRKGLVRTCYVNVGQAPLAVYRAWARGSYRRGIAPPGPMRIGAYGDPAALPYVVVRDLADRPDACTGYTHQWRTCDQRLSRYLQASCDSVAELAEAAAMGWRAFLVQPEGYQPADERSGWDSVAGIDAVECLSARGLQCADCGLCNGRTQHVWIRAHGTASAFVGSQ